MPSSFEKDQTVKQMEARSRLARKRGRSNATRLSFRVSSSFRPFFPLAVHGSKKSSVSFLVYYKGFEREASEKDPQEEEEEADESKRKEGERELTLSCRRRESLIVSGKPKSKESDYEEEG